MNTYDNLVITLEYVHNSMERLLSDAGNLIKRVITLDYARNNMKRYFRNACNSLRKTIILVYILNNMKFSVDISNNIEQL